MSAQGLIQAEVRTRHAQPGDRDWVGDWHCLFDEEEIFITDDGTPEPLRIAGTFNERLFKWLNLELVTDGDTDAPYGDLPGAQQAYAERTGAYNWNSMVTLL